MSASSINLLVTGGAGFIGSNFIQYWLQQHPQHRLINLDLLTYSGDLENVKDSADHPQYQFIQGDIRDKALVQQIMTQHDIRGVVHFAAESHVDNSIHQDSDIFFTTNVCGTQRLLQAAYQYWMQRPFEPKPGYESCRFHHISTDEVYGTLGAEGYFTEDTSHQPNSPYSASKSASDMAVRAYYHTFGLNVVTTNCSNNYGPKQHAEKFIPTVIRTALAEESIPVYGDGKNIRDWLYVLDHCQAIDKVFHQGQAGEVYNVGGDSEKTNIDLAHEICRLLDELHPRANGSYADLITYVTDRPGHDRRYAVDFSKLTRLCDWQPQHSFQQGLAETVAWYLAQAVVQL